jgi:hypothetical protein
MLYDKERWEPKVAPPKPKLKPWQKVLLKAADYIKKHGWVQHTLENGVGAVCILGAFRKVSTSFPVKERAECKLRDFLGVRNVPIFNDRRSTTMVKVLAALRAAAKQE